MIFSAGSARRQAAASAPEPVVDGDDHSGALRGQLAAVVVVALAVHQAAAVDPDQHRQVLEVAGAFAGEGGGPDVEVETVFVGVGRPGEDAEGGDLGAGGAVLGGFADVAPRRGLLGRAPAEVADRRGGVGDAEVAVDAVAEEAADPALVGGDDGMADGGVGLGAESFCMAGSREEQRDSRRGGSRDVHGVVLPGE
jgi:hypothetical protein